MTYLLSHNKQYTLFYYVMYLPCVMLFFVCYLLYQTCTHNQESLFGFGFMTIGKRSQDGGPEISKQVARDVRSINRKSRETDEDMVLCLECSDDKQDQISKCGSRKKI